MRLPVHAGYSELLGDWEVARDVCKGGTAVKSKRTKYLKVLSSGYDYEAYLQRAEFQEIGKNTVEGFLGLVFRGDPTVDVPMAMDGYMKDCDNSGNGFQVLAKEVVKEVLTVGRCGVLTDCPPLDDSVLGLQGRIEPYSILYRAEDIIHWRVEKGPDGTRRLSQLILRENREVPVPDEPFVTVMEFRFAVWTLTPYGVIVQRFKGGSLAGPGGSMTGLENAEPDGPVIMPKAQRSTQRLNRIPFRFFNAGNCEADASAPPLLGLFRTNISHFVTSADLAMALHFVGCPQGFAIGFTPVSGELTFGSSSLSN